MYVNVFILFLNVILHILKILPNSINLPIPIYICIF